ncbi:Ttc23 [Phodopus roborovskii]|uniref:Ttc23 protein n=1 Tax=Phodopus roborovskii TaxID=109678 RepID=A0AAV0AAL2_PHORO|nr:Ttc23 [Phodopus roborovskii]
MQESQEVLMPNHLDEVIAAVSVTSKKRIPNKLLQTALFQPPREKLHLCKERAKSYSSSCEYKQAIQELVRCVALTRICYGDSHWKLAEAYVNLAQGYLQLKGLSLQAKQHAEKAKEILANSIESPYHDNTDIFKCSLELFYTMGKALLSLQKVCQGQKRSKEALPYYQKALEYTEITKDAESLECVPILRELAGVEQALGFHDAAVNVAEQYFQESMTHVKGSEGAGRAKFLSIQDEFCNFLQITGQKERATMILRESLEAKVGAFGDFSPEVAETYRVLGRADLAQGNHCGAHTKLKKCVQIETFLYGSQDKRTLATQQTVDTLSKISEVSTKPRQSLKAKTASCTSAPQYTVPGKARHNAAD